MMKVKIGKDEIELQTFPNNCPFCHRSIIPQPIHGIFRSEEESTLDVLSKCPNVHCKRSFVAIYEWSNNPHPGFFFSGETLGGTFQVRSFSETIDDISSSFVSIYNEAYGAEQHGYLAICGVGYRKALEFLIKDYAILLHPDDEEDIKKKLLYPCIEKYITSEQVKDMAKRAVWLGNDETHYVRRWEGMDLKNMKRIIDLTIHWIEMELLTAQTMADMPDN